MEYNNTLISSLYLLAASNKVVHIFAIFSDAYLKSQTRATGRLEARSI